MRSDRTRKASARSLAVVTAGLAGFGGVGGCNGTTEAPPPERLPEERDVRPQFESEREGLRMGQGLDQFQPAAVLEQEDMTLVFPLPSAAQVQVHRVEAEQSVEVARAEGRQGQLLVVDRGEGVRLGDQRLRNGPLQRDRQYVLYVLPPGGVRQEVTRTTVRPPTREEIEAAREEREEREAEEREAGREGTGPATGPSP